MRPYQSGEDRLIFKQIAKKYCIGERQIQCYLIKSSIEIQGEGRDAISPAKTR